MTAAQLQLAKWVNSNTQHSHRYYLSTLHGAQQKFYHSYYNAAASQLDCCEVPPGMTDSMIKTVIELVLLDTPSLFYVSNGYAIVTENGVIKKVKLGYSMTVDQTLTITQQLEHAADRILHPLRLKSSYQKKKEIHDYLIRNVRYKKSSGREIYSIFGPLIYGYGVCAGIARSTKFLLDKLGVKSIVLSGTTYGDPIKSVPEPHAWNMVECDGQLYHMDVTFDLTCSSLPNICYSYFDLTDQQICCDHWSEYSCPASSGIRNDYHTRNGLYFADQAELSRAFSRRTDNRFFTFRLPQNSPTFSDSRVKEMVSKMINDSLRPGQSCSYCISSNLNQRVYTLTFS